MIFVTGGTGLVGTRLIFDLVSNGEKVFALKRNDASVEKFLSNLRFYTSNTNKISENITWVKGDLSDIDWLKKIIPEQAEVYHCAAMVSFNPKHKNEIIEINVDGTKNLVNACLENNIRKLCHISSIGALGGKVNGQPIDENTPWSSAEKSTYSISKHYSEMEVWRGIAEGLNAVIVNPAVILGAGDWIHGTPKLFSMIARGIKFYTKGTTNYVDVRDVSKAMILLMKAEISEERFILASDNLSYQELFIKISEALGVKTPTIYAGKLMTGLAYRIDRIKSFFTQKEATFTKQTHKIAHTIDVYKGNKITEKTGFTYTPISETIKFIGSCYLNTR